MGWHAWRAGALAVAILLTLTGSASADDRQAGYYYPKPKSSELYVALARTLIDSDRSRRISFVNDFTAAQYARPQEPPVALFAKGDQAEKLIIVSLNDGYANTLYRMRGLLAMMTSVVRQTDLFRSLEVDELFTFIDLLKMLGFKQLTLTNGRDFAHQVFIR
ncbi:MAG: molybdopterin-guanine dinucleotide biosynthesis protein A [Proteobacteria bacterium]|nr:molybdopterin-guanine dinucleotide biosynthesis protein A [Pseudomonadota bacterium]MBI3495920.1 molybdopterin-guanine dinucleotide biosynthesis protein A [Pseudomonadota bacterium]